MLHNEKELVKSLKCDELCSISEKKELNKKLRDKRIKKLAEKEMDANFCPPCHETNEELD
jgi:hypothetical protein